MEPFLPPQHHLTLFTRLPSDTLLPVGGGGMCLRAEAPPGFLPLTLTARPSSVPADPSPPLPGGPRTRATPPSLTTHPGRPSPTQE